MSNYTSQLRYICEVQSGFTPAELNEKTIDEIITAAQPKIFNFRYPIYDESYRNVLEHEILFHFYMREIGAETYGLFNYYLARKCVKLCLTIINFIKVQHLSLIR